MTSHERKLISQVLALCEKQYRKGVQHGAHAAMQQGSTDAADRFRFDGMRRYYRKHDWFNWPRHNEEGAKDYALHLAYECPNCEELAALLTEFGMRLGERDIIDAYDKASQ
jgi:hypothetical protein